MTEKAPNDDEVIVQRMDEYLKEFDTLSQVRHDMGQEEYGAFTFLENDVIRMMLEELIDTSNYCRYQFIKLRMLQDLLEGKLETMGFFKEGEEDLKVNLGAQAFKGTGEGWNK